MKRALLVLMVLLLAPPAFAQYTYTTVDYPGASIARLVGFNDHFEAVGHFQMPGAPRHAMRLVDGKPVPLVDADGVLQSTMSAADQINNRGDITGWYQTDTRHGFVLRNGVLTTVDYPGATWTMVCGITDTGLVFGYFYDVAGLAHGFALEDGAFSQIDYPGARDTIPYYINARGDLVGNMTTLAGVGHGFLLTKHGEWYAFDAPGARANSTIAIGINDHQQILGALIDAGGAWRGFVVDARAVIAGADAAAFTVFDLPSTAACPETANNSGAFVGYYNDAKGVHGFIGTPVRGNGR